MILLEYINNTCYSRNKLHKLQNLDLKQDSDTYSTILKLMVHDCNDSTAIHILSDLQRTSSNLHTCIPHIIFFSLCKSFPHTTIIKIFHVASKVPRTNIMPHKNKYQIHNDLVTEQGQVSLLKWQMWNLVLIIPQMLMIKPQLRKIFLQIFQ